jgi:hypothetical protein
VVIRRCKSKKDRKHKGQKKKVKRTNNYLPNITQKIIDPAIMIPLTSGVNPKEYNEKWTGEIFKVTHRIMRGGLPIYRLKDFHDEEIKGTFYQSELQKVDVRDDDIWKIEKILKTKGKGNNKQYFIKWLH